MLPNLAFCTLICWTDQKSLATVSGFRVELKLTGDLVDKLINMKFAQPSPALSTIPRTLADSFAASFSGT